MKAELEALVLALDAVRQAKSGPEADRLYELYLARLGDVLRRNPGLSAESLEVAIDLQHRRWLRAQQKPTSLPPKA